MKTSYCGYDIGDFVFEPSQGHVIADNKATGRLHANVRHPNHKLSMLVSDVGVSLSIFGSHDALEGMHKLIDWVRDAEEV